MIEKSNQTSVLMKYSHMGMQFALSFGIFVFGGIYLDGKWNLSPLGVILGAFLGFALAFYQLLKTAKEMEKALEKEEQEEKENKKNQKDYNPKDKK